MSSAGDWCLIESDPGVFTELIRGFGCQGVQVEQIWSLDQDTFRELKPVHGLIFLFKWVPDSDPDGSLVQDSQLEKIFFAKQVIGYVKAVLAKRAVDLSILDIYIHEESLGDKYGYTEFEFKSKRVHSKHISSYQVSQMEFLSKLLHEVSHILLPYTDKHNHLWFQTCGYLIMMGMISHSFYMSEFEEFYFCSTARGLNIIKRTNVN